MEIFKAFLGFLGAIAWPLAVLIVVLVFHRPLYRLLERVSKDAKSIKGAGIEIELFDRELEKALASENPPQTVDEAFEVARKAATVSAVSARISQLDATQRDVFRAARLLARQGGDRFTTDDVVKQMQSTANERHPALGLPELDEKLIELEDLGLVRNAGVAMWDGNKTWFLPARVQQALEEEPGLTC